MEFSDTDMKSFLIREAEFNETEDIAYIEEECFSTPWSKKSLDESFSHTPWHFFVAIYENKIVGYGGVYVILDEGQISNIAVLPAFRGKKIGLAILEKIIDFCKNEGLEKITLELRESNYTALSLYKKCGFDIVGKRPKFYSNPTETAILMDKHI